jgi:2-polyprenyl-6-methoxyphenol hydroxylase-like FAD-dependent oxidoreductase
LPVTAIEGPQRFPVRVGWAPRWHTPGLLLLGDAAHPMSPVRAQGINMALRDALVAARLMGPLAGQAADALAGGTAAADARRETVPVASDPAAAMDEVQRCMDALLPRIAARRLPEIRRMQALQASEAGLGARLRQLGWLRRGLAATAPWSGRLARARWIQRQHRLRQGLPGALPLPE